MFRALEQGASARALGAALVMAALVLGVSTGCQEAKPVDCAKDCPCKCEEPEPVDCPEPDDVEDIAKSNEPYPLVFAGNVKVNEGSLDPTIAKRKVTAQRYALRECYAPALKKDPTLKGEMDVQFTVSGSTGKIIASIVRESTIEDKTIQKCVTKTVKKLSFPKSDSKESVVRFTAVMLAVNL